MSVCCISGGFAINLGGDYQSLVVSKGQEKIKSWQLKLPNNSLSHNHRTYCSVCQTYLWVCFVCSQSKDRSLFALKLSVISVFVCSASIRIGRRSFIRSQQSLIRLCPLLRCVLCLSVCLFGSLLVCVVFLCLSLSLSDCAGDCNGGRSWCISWSNTKRRGLMCKRRAPTTKCMMNTPKRALKSGTKIVAFGSRNTLSLLPFQR